MTILCKEERALLAENFSFEYLEFEEPITYIEVHTINMKLVIYIYELKKEINIGDKDFRNYPFTFFLKLWK